MSVQVYNTPLTKNKLAYYIAKTTYEKHKCANTQKSTYRNWNKLQNSVGQSTGINREIDR